MRIETNKNGIINKGTYFNLNRGLCEDLSALHNHCIIIQASNKLVMKMRHPQPILVEKVEKHDLISKYHQVHKGKLVVSCHKYHLFHPIVLTLSY
jgi:hypothetical protein